MGSGLYNKESVSEMDRRGEVYDLSRRLDPTPEAYVSCIREMFADGKYNAGRIYVWFLFTVMLRERVAAQDRDRFDRCVLDALKEIYLTLCN